jgi:hypothetical protein
MEPADETTTRVARAGLGSAYAARVPSVAQVRISIRQVVTASAPAARHAASRAQSATQSGVAATKPYAKHIGLVLIGALVLVLMSVGARHRSHSAGA